MVRHAHHLQSDPAPVRPRRRPRRLTRAVGFASTVLAAVSWAVAAPAAGASGAGASARLTVAAPSASPASFCGITWGSLPKAAGSLSPTATLVGVRTGQHVCYDRLVVDLNGPLMGYDVRYVTVVLTEGSGVPVPVRGGAAIAVVVKAAAYDTAGQPTYTPPNPHELAPVAGYRTFAQVAWAGTFEGQSTIALGVRARLPFRAFTLAGPGTGSRLVVDVAHLW